MPHIKPTKSRECNAAYKEEVRRELSRAFMQRIGRSHITTSIAKHEEELGASKTKHMMERTKGVKEDIGDNGESIAQFKVLYIITRSNHFGLFIQPMFTMEKFVFRCKSHGERFGDEKKGNKKANRNKKKHQNSRM